METLKRKLSSRKFWALITALIIAGAAFFNAPPETTERIIAFISAFGSIAVYIFAESKVDAAYAASKEQGGYYE